jgi:cysteine desulfurase/selenocysteine lyase
VAVFHVSNVFGSIMQVEEIAEICKENGAMLLLDGAQSVPHLKVDVKKLGCDFLAFSGHKMLAPKGTGVLWIRKEIINEIEPLSLGGGTIKEVSINGYTLTDPWERFEAGTPNIGGGIALGKAVEYLREIGMEKIRGHEEKLTRKLLEGLLEIKNVEVYGPLERKQRTGVVSFNIKGLNPHDVALMLDETASIMVRSGHHCCMPLMRFLGTDGTVRASLYLYNTEEEIEKLLSIVEEISRSLA